MSRKKNEGFESLALPRKDVPHLMGSHYRVYSDYANFKVVAAENAQEAMENSGIQNPVRVARDTILLYSLLNLGANVSAEEISATPPANDTAPIATAPTVTEEAPASTEAPAAALSNNDVDTLLQG
jgi:hypothetical protein